MTIALPPSILIHERMGRRKKRKKRERERERERRKRVGCACGIPLKHAPFSLLWESVYLLSHNKELQPIYRRAI